MINKSDPRQSTLFHEEAYLFSEKAYEKLQEGWQHLFRTVLLELMPADELSENFSKTMGRPTKELYAMAGLVVIAMMYGWTAGQAAMAYMFDLSVQHALNMSMLRGRFVPARSSATRGSFA